MELIDQQVINDNKEIFAKIRQELLAAEFEILIATAWFTDEELFQIISDKLDEGVHTEIIIADNQENEKLDFSALSAKGAAVYKIRNSGYGMMNQKFCVIDKRIVLHGSYNWSVNAKKNNQESIIRTNHQETIQKLIENFITIRTRIKQQTEGLGASIPADININEGPKSIPIKAPANAASEFEKVLDSMIAAEVGSFDRKLLREQGYERCKANNGDHQVLHKAFDTVYSVFINDIDVIDDKKKRLIAKIDEHRVRTLDVLTQNCDLQMEHLTREQELTRVNLDNQLTTLEAEIAVCEKNMELIRSNKMSSLEKDQDGLIEQIKGHEREFIIPRFKWFELIPTIIFGSALLLYLFVFYSSAAYILLFSVADAEASQRLGIGGATSPQIFNPGAMTKALQKGGTAPLFVLLFVFIPLAFAIMDAFVQEKWKRWAGAFFGILILDGAIAYKVAEAVHEVNRLSGNTSEPWRMALALRDTNFYLVFVFGAFGLILFKMLFKNLMNAFAERNPDIQAQRTQLLIRQLKDEHQILQDKIMEFKESAIEIEKKVIQLEANRKRTNGEITLLPVTLNRALQNQRAQLILQKEAVEKTTAIYEVHIQSDNLPISVDALKDRMNVFLEGWNDHLFQEYAVARATAKTTQAFEVATTWQQEKLHKTKVDYRVKFNTSE